MPPSSYRLQVSSYRLQVDLEHVEPEVRRVLRVPGSISLDELHVVLQAAMGWEDRHLYRFRIGDEIYADPEWLDLREVQVHAPETRVLHDLSLQPADEFQYVYDFGDRWSHRIRVEEIETGSDNEEEGTPAVCLDGVGRCPPEDCGGPPGYRELLLALDDPAHPRHEELARWAGPALDPEAFSPSVANATLLALFEPGGRLAPGPGPEVMQELDDILDLQLARSKDEDRITDTVLSVAEELLLLHCEEDPEGFLRTRKSATWSAGALHAAFLELRRWRRRKDRMTLDELGQRFEVSPGSVSRRSRALRQTARHVDFLPFPSGSPESATLLEALERIEGPEDEKAAARILAHLLLTADHARPGREGPGGGPRADEEEEG